MRGPADGGWGGEVLAGGLSQTGMVAAAEADEATILAEVVEDGDLLRDAEGVPRARGVSAPASTELR